MSGKYSFIVRTELKLQIVELSVALSCIFFSAFGHAVMSYFSCLFKQIVLMTDILSSVLGPLLQMHAGARPHLSESPSELISVCVCGCVCMCVCLLSFTHGSARQC